MVLLCEVKLSFLNQIHWSCFLLYSFSMYFWSINMIWDWHISWLFLFSFRYTLICLLFEKTFMKVKGYNKIQFFTQEFIHTFVWYHQLSLRLLMQVLYNLKAQTNEWHIFSSHIADTFWLILSGKVTLNPGPVYSNQWNE